MDLLLLHWLNRLGTIVALDDAAWIMTDYPVLILAIPVVVYLLFPPGPRFIVIRTLVLTGLVALLAYGAVDVVASPDWMDRLRPYDALPGQVVRGNTSEIDNFSFPSRLTVVTTAIATVMWRMPGKTARLVFIAIAAWAAVSRPMMGLNWPSDIVGSALLGWLTAQLLYWLLDPASPVRRWFVDS